MRGADYMPFIVQRLLELMQDRDASNRDWATYLLSQSSHSSPAIIMALTRNAAELDTDISAEAVLGLAKRDRFAARRLLAHKLLRRTLGELDIEAAGYVGHRSLLSSLRRIQKNFCFDQELMERAIGSCKSGNPEKHGFS